MHIQAASNAKTTDEYGGEFRRLFPWPETVDTPWGSAWMTVKPGLSSTPHSHSERETFIILGGTGLITVDLEKHPVAKGDVIYLPPGSRHTLQNTSASQDLELLCIWWDGQPD